MWYFPYGSLILHCLSEKQVFSTYLARNDFYESKILEILTTRAVDVLQSPSAVALLLGTSLRTLYLTYTNS